MASVQADGADKPLVVLMSRNPWRHFVGSDSPAFVLYENGLVIFERLGKDQRLEYVSVVLTIEEKEQFLASLSVANAFDNIASFYRLTLTTDQQTHQVLIWHQNKVHRVRLYGSLGKDYDYLVKIGELPVVPAPLLSLVGKIDRFDHKLAKAWHPIKMEIIVQPDSRRIKTAIAWPRDLPGIRHPTTVRRGGLYSIYVDYDRFVELSRVVKDRGGNPSFVIDGKTYFADFRMPFPGEAAWMQ